MSTKKPQLSGFFANSLTSGVAAVNVNVRETQPYINISIYVCATVYINGVYEVEQQASTRIKTIVPVSADSCLSSKRIISNNISFMCLSPIINRIPVNKIVQLAQGSFSSLKKIKER